MNSIKFNGKEVENPITRRALKTLAILVSLGIVAFLLFALLPFVGLVVTGILAIVLLVVLAIIPFAILKNTSSGFNFDFGSNTGDLSDE